MDYVVDGNNVVGSRPDGWWRDPVGARVRLVEDIAAFARAGEHRVVLFFDGRLDERSAAAARQANGLVRVRYAGGRGGADDAIVDMLAGGATAEGPGSAGGQAPELVLVTSDAGLVARVPTAGVRVMGSGSFRRLIDRAGG